MNRPRAKRMNLSKAPHRVIAAAVVIDTRGHLLLQLRDDKPDIIYPGRIGLFGGHREGSESALECVVRELGEELSYDIAPDRLEYLVSREGEDTEVRGGTFRGDFFLVRDIPLEKLVVTEGTLVAVARADLAKIDHKLTPTARLALDVFFAMKSV